MLYLISCNKNTSITNEYPPIFNEVNEILNRHSKFWDTKLYGPILLVNPTTREFISNQDTSTITKGILPDSVTIANTTVFWNSKQWVMITLPLPQNKLERNNLIIHELFHRMQHKIGFNKLNEANNQHLDTYQGRILLKLELEALKKALLNTSKDAVNKHLKNAFIFRLKRQKNDTVKMAENALEINEGIAEYTGMMLGRKNSNIEQHLIKNINNFYTNKTFVRSFAYQTIPVYGYLLSKTTPYWHKQIKHNTVLTDYFLKAFNIPSSYNIDYIEIAQQNDYNYTSIISDERKREQQKIALKKAYIKKFTQDTTLQIGLKNMNISFDPRNISPLDKLGTVYPNLKISDNWGILTVKNSALISVNWDSITVSKPNYKSDSILKGDGWKLVLKPNWSLIKNTKNYTLKTN